MIFPEYSVIIPTWNRASTVLTAIGSALNQTHPPLEVLVCDDASTDNTEELVRSLGDPRVIWLSGPRGGRPAIPRNRGIRVARGEWVAFLDSDDAWLPEKMEKQFTLAQALHCQAACTNAVKIVPKQPDFHETLLPWNSGERITLADQIATNNVITSSVALQRDLLLRAGGGFPEDAQLKVGEDYTLWLRICTFTDFAMVCENLVLYQDDAANSVRSNQPNWMTVRLRVFDNFAQWLQQSTLEVSLKTQYRQMVQKGRSRMRQTIRRERLTMALRTLHPIKCALYRLLGRGNSRGGSSV